VVARVRSGEGPAERVFVIRLQWAEVWWECPVDAGFFKEHQLDPPLDSGVLSIPDEDRADALMEELSPVCRACLAEWMHAASSFSP
jgi:hypothetical protein